ncbi:protein disulfide isomerase CRELD1 isoform X2 [Parasteatoda tepidariorum]|uniref:protein disulfide isomerase CRELD1 isoform X2 n=1 Tax=Parasteatoda tepidariorum TaxID=114398 RepID=UPI0039BD796E
MQINVKMKIIMCLCSLIMIFSNCSITATDISSLSSLESLSKASVHQKTVSPCSACRNLVESFIKAVGSTTRMSFEGGDADWEREKLGNYENSELRFIEIQEKLCSDLKSGIDQCYNLAELYEAELEEWFFNVKIREHSDLFSFLCINHIKICCPNNTYGPNCFPCPGGAEEPCNGHGTCKNGGTREEPAECICDAGYIGDLCNECKIGYYSDVTGSKLSCNMCDKSCRDHCRGPGPKNCEVCSDGYNFLPNEGCFEISKLNEEAQLSSENSSNETEHSDLQLNPDVLNLNGQQSDHQEL